MLFSGCLLAVLAVADADKGWLGVSRITDFPAQTTTLDLHPILLVSPGRAWPADHAIKDK
jgi:hypothetical protein